MAEEMQMTGLVLEAAVMDAFVQDVPMVWHQALFTAATGVALPTLDVVTDWWLVGRLLSHNITLNVS